MARSADFQDEISKGLECSVCMTLLHDPKVLKCHHWFCKSCIDELLEFDKDGSAVMICPMKCKELTFVKSNQTAGNLPIPYQLTSLLDVVTNRDQGIECEDLHCNGTVSCSNKVSLYCNCCSVMLCHECSRTHNENKHNNVKVFLPIQYEKKSEQIVVVCQEHSTPATYVCCKTKLICLYCKQRRHKKHRSVTVKHAATQLRQFVSSNEEKLKDMEKIIEHTMQSLHATKDSIDKSRSALKLTLRNRKLRCLSAYSEHLDIEEENILNEYDVMTQDHIARYPEPIMTDYFENITAKHDFQLLDEKERLTRNLLSFTSDGLLIPSIQIELSDCDLLAENTLGRLNSEMCAYLSVQDEKANSSFQSNFPSYFSTSDQLHIERLDEKLNGLKAFNEEFQASLWVRREPPPSPPVQKKHACEHEANSSASTSASEGKTRLESEELIELAEGLRETLVAAGHTEDDNVEHSDEGDDAEEDEEDDDDFEDTFNELRHELSDSVDLHFDSLLQAIQDQFIESMRTDDEADSDEESDNEEEEDVDAADQVGVEADADNGDGAGYSDNGDDNDDEEDNDDESGGETIGGEDIEQICRQS